MYKDHLHRPTDTELRLDLQLLEDQLDVTSILAAREQAKMEVRYCSLDAHLLYHYE